MMTLPTRDWGSGDADRHALLIHGINGSSATWGRLADAMARDGWHVTAADLRGHGDAARADDYSHAAYASDLPGTDWDLVVGHSLGGAVGTLAAARSGFTRALALLDPVLVIPDEDFDAVHAEQLSELDETLDDIRRSRAHWHPADQLARFEGSQKADRGMVDGTFAQNRPWNVIPAAEALRVPTLILGADPAVFAFFRPESGARIVDANPLVRYTIVPGAGHSPHKDDPQATVALLREFTSAGAPQP